ncbi:uncharacterized protein SOCEGT47_045920 [Sorangium cellulosum]|uniref:Uncharacterized protein n=1 Tax=Sorangium cellulosum TaxID=56 RepID=A0A4P2Q422_SORCE|nr:uncharacterized protein SOCEGT47_045920 [Sorangium cellulosum]
MKNTVLRRKALGDAA